MEKKDINIVSPRTKLKLSWRCSFTRQTFSHTEGKIREGERHLAGNVGTLIRTSHQFPPVYLGDGLRHKQSNEEHFSSSASTSLISLSVFLRFLKILGGKWYWDRTPQIEFPTLMKWRRLGSKWSTTALKSYLIVKTHFFFFSPFIF